MATIEDLWETLGELSQALVTDDGDPGADALSRAPEEAITQLRDEVEDDEALEDDYIPENFVFTRFILRQSLRFQEYVSQRRIGAARESWELIIHHSAECPDVIDPDLELCIGEVLDELLSRSPISSADRVTLLGVAKSPRGPR